jgi:hypothetical protein
MAAGEMLCKKFLFNASEHSAKSLSATITSTIPMKITPTTGLDGSLINLSDIPLPTNLLKITPTTASESPPSPGPTQYAKEGPRTRHQLFEDTAGISRPQLKRKERGEGGNGRERSKSSFFGLF